MEHQADRKNVFSTLGVGFGGTGYSLLELPWDKLVAIASFIYVCIQIYKAVAPTVKGWFKKNE